MTSKEWAAYWTEFPNDPWLVCDIWCRGSTWWEQIVDDLAVCERERDKWKLQTEIEKDRKFFCEARLAKMREVVKDARNLGHNDDCLFCGFKDKRLDVALRDTEDLEENNPGKIQRELDDTMEKNDRYLRSCSPKEETT